MAHYALINANNVVVQVITGVDENIVQTDTDGTKVGGTSEAWEIFYASRPWFTGLSCKRTSYNNNIRKQYAGIGFSYDPVADVFIAPQPYPSWSLDADHNWQAPTPKPEEGFWYWDEETLSWVEVELPAE
jgi:hypothetical protein